MMAGSRVNAAVDLAWLMVKGRPAIARTAATFAALPNWGRF